MSAMEVIPAAVPRHSMSDPEAPVQVTMTLPRKHLEKLTALLDSGAWERAQAAREANLAECTKSVAALLDCARRHIGTSGGRVCATLLASLYNGERVRLDVSDLRRLDAELFEHAMNTLRLCYETNSEPHTFFAGGGEIFERLIADWGLEKKRRARK